MTEVAEQYKFSDHLTSLRFSHATKLEWDRTVRMLFNHCTNPGCTAFFPLSSRSPPSLSNDVTNLKLDLADKPLFNRLLKQLIEQSSGCTLAAGFALLHSLPSFVLTTTTPRIHSASCRWDLIVQHRAEHSQVTNVNFTLVFVSKAFKYSASSFKWSWSLSIERKADNRRD